jgi:hypothetical protein
MPLFAKGSSPLSVFPTFLLPSSRQFPPHKQQEIKVQPKAGNKRDRAHESHVSYIRCARCGADICLTSQIISKGFTGRHGRAYLVSGHGDVTSASAAAAPSATSLSNTITQKAVPRQLVTGAHTVCDLSCVICGSVLGWKYIAAEEESQRYKVGNFILETKRISISSCWDMDSTATITSTPSSPSTSPPQAENADVEFDSQDEDECEDLFAGIWTPTLATRRRNRKLDGRR